VQLLRVGALDAEGLPTGGMSVSRWVARATGAQCRKNLLWHEELWVKIRNRRPAGSSLSVLFPAGRDAVLARRGRRPSVSSCPPCQNDNRVRMGMPFTLVKSPSSDDGSSTSGMINSEMAMELASCSYFVAEPLPSISMY
jgi:hypothetical protein